MIFRSLAISILVLAPLTAWGASKEIIELGRDVAQLQDQVRTLQRSFDERMAGQQVLLQQALDAANKANTSVNVLESGVKDQLRSQSDKVAAPVAGFGAKLDNMSQDVQVLRESVKELTSIIGRMQTQLVDISNSVRTMPAPQAAPPPSPVSGGAPPNAAMPIVSAPDTARPAVPAGVLWQSANRDMKSGKPDLALTEFSDYIRMYPNTEFAPAAQFNIGQIHYTQGDLQSAIKDFDMVIEKYPSNNRTPDAFFMKGKALVQSGSPAKGAQEFKTLIAKYPHSDLAVSAKAQLRALGVNTTTRRR